MKPFLALCVASLFLVSGMTSLVYQTVWIRVLSLGVGSTSTSTSLVLAIFFFGLSVGSAVFGRRAAQYRKPLVVYGIVEAFIGLYSFALVYILFEFHGILATIYSGDSFSAVGIGLKFLLVFLLLMPPTICMGASLPLLVSLFSSASKSMGRSLSLLYGINTIGAVAGAFLAGYVFIPEYGIVLSNNVMAVINILILPASVFLTRYLGESKTSKSADGGKKSFRLSELSFNKKLILGSVFVTGFASISAEVIWSKYLSIYFGSNIFGLSLLLSIFLGGLAAGSLVLSLFIHKIENKKNLYLVLLSLVTAFTLFATVSLNFAPVLTNLISYFVGPSVSVLAIKAVVAGGLLFLPTSVLGALLPLSITLVTKNKGNAAAVTGYMYGLNTLGSILGSAVTGLILIPNWGSGVALQIDIILLASFGLLLTFYLRQTQRVVFFIVFSALFASSFVSDKVSFNNIIKSAYYQVTPEGLTLNQALEYFSKESEEFSLIVEGRTAIISLSKSPFEGDGWENYYRLKTNGLNESLYDQKRLSNLPKYEALLGLLPYALVRNPKTAFVVGYGGGFTVDMLSRTDLKKVYVSELEKGIIDAAQYIYDGQNPILKRENVSLRIDDARYILTTGLEEKYDIIVSQPSHSWLTGVANLFTKEYFEIVRDNLSEKGVFSQWLNLYNMDKTVLKSILKTFFSVFPHGAIFTDMGDEEMIMVGSFQPVKYNMRRLERIISSRSLNGDMDEYPNMHALLASYTVNRETLMPSVADAKINTDRNAFAEVRQSRIFYSGEKYYPEEYLQEFYTGDVESVLDGPMSAEDHLGILDALQLLPGEAKSHQKFYRYLKKVEKALGQDPAFAARLGYYKYQLEQYATAKEYLRNAMRTTPSSEILNTLLQISIDANQFDEAKTDLRNFRKFRDETSSCYELMVAIGDNRWRVADRIAKKLQDGNRDCGGFREKFLGAYHYYKGELNEAIVYLADIVEMDPYDLDAHEMLISSYFMIGQSTNAMSQAEAYRPTYNAEKERLAGLIDFYKAEGLYEDVEQLQQKFERFR